MNKKKLYIVVALIALVALIILVIINIPKPKKAEKITAKEIKEETKTTVESLITTELDYDKFTSIVGKNVPNVHIALGPNSYLRNKPSDEVMKKYNLTKYISQQEQLVKKVEKRYLDSLNYEIKDTLEAGNQICQDVEIISYYYALYLYDFIELSNNIVSADAEDAATSKKAQAEYYKGCIKALKVLDNHLDDYENTEKEKITASICYKNGKADSNEVLSLIGALQGENYSNMNMSSELNQVKANERLAKYLEEAKNINI